MDSFYSRCGFSCSNCASYCENLKTLEDRELCSSSWFKYLGFRIKPEKLIACSGCSTPDKEKPNLYINCKVRKCANINEVPNCGYCSGFPCEDSSNISFDADKRKKIEEKLGYPMPENDYLKYVESYEGVKHLHGIRASISEDDIIEMKTFSAAPKTAAFPEKISGTGKRQMLKEIYGIIADLDSVKKTTYARKLVLGKRRPNLLRLLFMFGLHGETVSSGGIYLLVDSETYSKQKIISYHHVVLEYFSILSKSGVVCKIIPENDGWLTPKGGLRRSGWKMSMKFNRDEHENLEMIILLKDYADRLYDAHGKNALRYFSRADMNVFM